MEVKIITPTGLYEECSATQINACSVEGEFGLLSNHMPMVVMLQVSRLEIVNNNERKEYAIAGGMLHFSNNKVNILTDSIEGNEEIDIERAQKAKARAEKRLQSNDADYHRAELALKKAINRLKVGK